MSYNLTLDCGCTVYVSCDPQTKAAHTRVIEQRGPRCEVRKHEVGLRLYLWDLLPDRRLTAVDECGSRLRAQGSSVHVRPNLA